MLMLLTFTSHIVLACSYIKEPMVKFNPQEYVFYGEVVAVVGPIKSSKILRDAWGLKLKVTHGFNLPNNFDNHFEVYPLGMTNACEKTGISSEALQRFYTIGSKVRVVGVEDTWFDSKSADKIIRLFITEMNSGLIARNDMNDGFDSTIEAVYDYKKDKTHSRSDQDKAAIFYSDSWLGDFELRKDLIRLQEAKKEAERFTILQRLSDYSYYHIDYEQLLKNYIQDKKWVNQLLMERAQKTVR